MSNDKGLGKQQRKALEFIERVDGWHSFAPDVKRSIIGLGERGLVEVSGNQYRLVVRMHCDQCEMLSINGVACHETGCLNSRKTWSPANGGWVDTYTCRECGSKEVVGFVCCTE